MGLISRVSSRTHRKSRVKFKKKTNTKPKMSFVINNENFQHILRIQNTNIDGNIKIGYALTSIQGMGRRFTDLVLNNAEELERIQTTMTNPKNFKIPTWFLNRQKDIKDGKDSQLTSNALSNKLREDLERMKKIRLHRGIRHMWTLRVKG